MAYNKRSAQNRLFGGLGANLLSLNARLLILRYFKK
jgi:hypothetical protein